MSGRFRFTPEMRATALGVAIVTGLVLDAIQPDENSVSGGKPEHSVGQDMSHVEPPETVHHVEPSETVHHVGPEQTFHHMVPETVFSHVGPETVFSHVGPEQVVHHVSDHTPVMTSSMESDTVRTERVVVRAAEIPFVDTPEQKLARSHQRMTDEIRTMEKDLESTRAAMVTANEMMLSMNPGKSPGKSPGTTAGNSDLLLKSGEEQQELDSRIDAGMRIFNDRLVMEYLDSVQAWISDDVDQATLNRVIDITREKMVKTNESRDVIHVDITSDQYIDLILGETAEKFSGVLAGTGVESEIVTRAADAIGPLARKIINRMHDANLVDKFVFGLERVFARIDAFGMSEINTAIKKQVAAVNDKGRKYAGDLSDETILGNIADSFVDVLANEGLHTEADFKIRDLAEDRVARLLAGFNPFLDEYDYPVMKDEDMLEVAEMDISLDLH